MEQVPEGWRESKAFLYVGRAMVTYRRYLDKVTPHTIYRWVAFYGLMILFMARIFFTEGWYIVCYTHSIYLLNLFLAFLTPKMDPSLEQASKDDLMEEGITESNQEDFKPFIRRLPEFQFWYKATLATVFALFASMFSVFDIPVFWPILLVYFIILFTLTMRRQIQHMVKYRYLPFDIGKARYK